MIKLTNTNGHKACWVMVRAIEHVQEAVNGKALLYMHTGAPIAVDEAPEVVALAVNQYLINHR